MLLFFVLPALATAVALVCYGQTAQAVQTVPYKMNFQGRLTDTTGTPKADGTYNIRFRIYNAANTAVWTEDHLVSASAGVALVNGLFTVQLGSITPLDPALFNTATANQNGMTLEVELPTPATATNTSPSWTEGAMTPRSPIATSAYAFNSDTLDGLDSSVLARKDTTNTFSTSNTFNGTSVFSVNDPSAVGIQNTSGTKAFTANTSNMVVQVGSSTADASSVVLVLDTKNTAGDPTGAQQVAGSMYYNSNSGKFRCYQGAAWTDCITTPSGGSTLQVAYTSSTGSTTPEIKLDATRGGLNIQDADTSIAATLFGVHASNAGGLGTALFSVSNTGVIVARPTANTPNSFAVENSAGTNLFTIDSQNNRVYIGDSTGASSTLLVLASNTADGAAVPGAMYYNTTTSKFRCYQENAWVDCVAPMTKITLGADVTNNNATPNTLQDVTGLSFNVVAGKTYRFEAFITYTSAAITTGSRWVVNGPTNSFLSTQVSYVNTTAYLSSVYNASVYNVPTAATAGSLASGNSAVIKGLVTPTASGTIQIRFASEIASSAIIAKAGSVLRYWVE